MRIPRKRTLFLKIKIDFLLIYPVFIGDDIVRQREVNIIWVFDLDTATIARTLVGFVEISWNVHGSRTISYSDM